jgi:hypothetical protein
VSDWTTADVVAHFRKMGLANPIEAARGQEPKRSKYNATRTQVGDIWFASKAEARAFQVLKIAEGHQLVTSLRLQPRYPLQESFTDAYERRHRAVVYVADFEFVRGGRLIAVDVKGYQTPAFRIKAKLFAQRYPDILLEIWK